MKKGLLNTLTPFAVTLYKSFQQKHPLIALGIGSTVMLTWGALTAITQSGILINTPLEHYASGITNVLSFLGMGVNLLLSASNIKEDKEDAATKESVLESKEIASMEIVKVIKQGAQKGSIQDILNKVK